MFVECFPSEFREMSMQKAVLPCSMDGSRPFVAPDGSLPCPALSTYNALRYLQGHPEAMAKAEARAKAQMEKIFMKGVQVERIECTPFCTGNCTWRPLACRRRCRCSHTLLTQL